ncbi:CsbD family protein [Methylobacterium sp. Leaf87]|uniref:CsbD family protein n=1 Tax=Methylobacterium sp. Leaf87 TaxID=1736243 RepID=UPI000B152FFB|nr:CsbD family protein [Methylobacterium sp. Leaf87]
MNAQKTTDASDKVKGSITEAIGKLVGDSKVEAEGKSQKKLPKSDAKPKTTSKP